MSRYERIFNKADTLDADDGTDDATFAAALHFLVHSPHGAGVLRRVFPTGAGSTADIEHLARLIAREWRAYARASDDAERDGLQPWADVIGEANTHKGTAAMDSTAPVLKIAKAFADSGRSFMSESELTEKIFEYAQLDRRANESPHQAFARTFGANTPEGVLFRKAVAVAKTADMRPVGSDDGDAAKAYAKLTRLAEQERARHPGLTPEQAFAKCFADPANKSLAELAHQRPVAVW
jgi:hypothetical protein